MEENELMSRVFEWGIAPPFLSIYIDRLVSKCYTYTDRTVNIAEGGMVFAFTTL